MSTPKHSALPLYALLLAAVGGTVAYLLSDGALGGKEVGTAFLAVIGTFVGALFAFRLSERKELRAEARQHRVALNRALFIVLRQYNAMRWLKTNMDEHPEDYQISFNFPALKPPEYKDLVHDFDSLAFLFEDADPSLLMRLLVEQEGFQQSLESLKARNEFYVGEVQPAIAKLGVNRKVVQPAEFRANLGERLFEGAMSGALLARKNVNESCVSLLSLHGELFSVAKKLFPDTKFLKPAPDA